MAGTANAQTGKIPVRTTYSMNHDAKPGDHATTKAQANAVIRNQAKGGKGKGGGHRGGGGGRKGGRVDPIQQLAASQVSQAEMPIEQQIKMEKQSNLQAAKNQMGFAKAAAAIMQNAAPAVQDAYSGAANADAGYARGLGSGVQAQLNQNQAQDNAFLKQMGTPQGALTNAAPVGDTAYGLQGYIPATSLQREGAAWEAAAQLAPGNTLHAGQQLAQQTLANDPNLAKLQDELTKIAATQPSVYDHLLNSFNTAQYHNASIKQRQEQLGLTAQRDAVLAQQGQERISLEAQRAAQTALSENRNYRIALGRLGVSQRNAQLRALQLEAKKQGGGFTPDELMHIKNTAANMAQSLHDGVPATSTKSALPPKNYKAAFRYMVAHGIPPSIAIKELKSAGYKLPVSPATGNGQGMFTNLAKYLAGGSAAGGRRGGMADYGITQGVGAQLGQEIGGAYAHSHNAGGFLPKGLGFEYDRHDQGRDIQTRPGAPIIAPGDGYVVRIASDPGGGGAHFGPSYPIVHFTSGPYAGRDVYIGHTVAAVRPGERFRAGSVLSHTQNSGPMNGGAPSGWAEIGFAPGGTPGAFDQPAPF